MSRGDFHNVSYEGKGWLSSWDVVAYTLTELVISAFRPINKLFKIG